MRVVLSAPLLLALGFLNCRAEAFTFLSPRSIQFSKITSHLENTNLSFEPDDYSMRGTRPRSLLEAKSNPEFEGGSHLGSRSSSSSPASSPSSLHYSMTDWPAVQNATDEGTDVQIQPTNNDVSFYPALDLASEETTEPSKMANGWQEVANPKKNAKNPATKVSPLHRSKPHLDSLSSTGSSSTSLKSRSVPPKVNYGGRFDGAPTGFGSVVADLSTDQASSSTTVSQRLMGSGGRSSGAPEGFGSVVTNLSIDPSVGSVTAKSVLGEGEERSSGAPEGFGSVISDLTTASTGGSALPATPRRLQGPESYKTPTSNSRTGTSVAASSTKASTVSRSKTLATANMSFTKSYATSGKKSFTKSYAPSSRTTHIPPNNAFGKTAKKPVRGEKGTFNPITSNEPSQQGSTSTNTPVMDMMSSTSRASRSRRPITRSLTPSDGKAPPTRKPERTVRARVANPILRPGAEMAMKKPPRQGVSKAIPTKEQPSNPIVKTHQAVSATEPSAAPSQSSSIATEVATKLTLEEKPKVDLSSLVEQPEPGAITLFKSSSPANTKAPSPTPSAWWMEATSPFSTSFTLRSNTTARNTERSTKESSSPWKVTTPGNLVWVPETDDSPDRQATARGRNPKNSKFWEAPWPLTFSFNQKYMAPSGQNATPIPRTPWDAYLSPLKFLLNKFNPPVLGNSNTENAEQAMLPQPKELSLSSSSPSSSISHVVANDDSLDSMEALVLVEETTADETPPTEPPQLDPREAMENGNGKSAGLPEYLWKETLSGNFEFAWKSSLEEEGISPPPKVPVQKQPSTNPWQYAGSVSPFPRAPTTETHHPGWKTTSTGNFEFGMSDTPKASIAPQKLKKSLETEE